MMSARGWALGLALVAMTQMCSAEPTEPETVAQGTHRLHGLQSDVDHSSHGMTLDSGGSTMNSNTSELPRDCEEISGEREFTVYAGVAYAADFPGTTFGFSQHEYLVEPCSLVTIVFVNEDEVRHQWMIHGLPKYLYNQGMFHVEAAGGYTRKGSFIVPSDDRTYLVHCDVPQHMEKGMKGQLKVGDGNGNLWSVPGKTAGLFRDSYTPRGAEFWIAGSIVTGMIVIYILYGIRRRKRVNP